MNNFDWIEFKKGNIIIHCDTLEKARDFLIECYYEKEIKKWSDESSLLKYNRWDDYEENTCYHYEDEMYHGNLEGYKKYNYNIIEWVKINEY